MKTPAKHRQEWTSDDQRKVRDLADRNTPTRLIALKTGRTEDAVRAEAHKLGVSLRPTNQSPYNRRKG